MVRTLDHWYDGGSRPPHGGMYLDRTSPRDGRLICRVAAGDEHDVTQAVESARQVAPGWAITSPETRGRQLHGLAQAIRESAAQLIEEECEETGKARQTAADEVEGAARYFEFYGQVIGALGGETIDLGPQFHSFTRREPYGVVGVITPWNLPINQAARACAPAIAAGNVVVLKPSSLTSTTSIRLAELASRVGIPRGVVNVLLGSGAAIGGALASHHAVRKIAFTGSVDVGRSLAHVGADGLIPLTLELGGKNANLVFADADLDQAAAATVRGFTQNAGQVCSAASRLIVQEDIRDAMVEAIVGRVVKLSLEEDVGPVINETQYLSIRRHLEVAEREGAIAEVGGTAHTDAVPNPSRGLYVAPTVYSNVNPDMRIARDEVFGPVLVVLPFGSDEEAVAIANDSSFGLVAGVWTSDITRALRTAARLEAGQVYVNSWWSGGVETPFGGYKQSGYGREKGIEALYHYTQSKCVTVALR